MPVKVEPERCDGCGLCVEVCPLDALRLDGGKPVMRYDECWYCGACVEDCPRKALKLKLPYLVS